MPSSLIKVVRHRVITFIQTTFVKVFHKLKHKSETFNSGPYYLMSVVYSVVFSAARLCIFKISLHCFSFCKLTVNNFKLMKVLSVINSVLDNWNQYPMLYFFIYIFYFRIGSVHPYFKPFKCRFFTWFQVNMPVITGSFNMK